MPYRFQKYVSIAFDTEEGRKRKKKRDKMTVADEKMYQAICLWKDAYEERFNINQDFGSWIRRNFRILFVSGLLAAFISISVNILFRMWLYLNFGVI